MGNEFKKYLNINEKTIEGVRKVILKRYFKKGFIEKLKLLIELNKVLSKIYKIKINPIKIVPYNIANKNSNKEYILIGDSLSLISFLSKFKKLMNLSKIVDEDEVILKRDSLDWSLSILQISTNGLIDKIFEKKQEILEDEEELENYIQLNLNGGNTRWKEVF